MEERFTSVQKYAEKLKGISFDNWTSLTDSVNFMEHICGENVNLAIEKTLQVYKERKGENKKAFISRMENYCKALEGITYKEWCNLEVFFDLFFTYQRKKIRFEDEACAEFYKILENTEPGQPIKF